MSNLNAVYLSGRLTRDPELRNTTNGTAVANTGIAVERYRKDAEPEVSFFDLTVWAGFGELVAAKARKGDKVTVEGRLQQQTWETAEGKRSKVEVVVNQMEGEFLYRKSDGSDTPARAEQQELPTGDTTAAGAPPAEATDDDIPF